MKNTISKTIFAVLALCTAFYFSNCKKNSSPPETTCKTCEARSFSDNQLINQQQVCTAEDEDNFQKTFSEFKVSCK